MRRSSPVLLVTATLMAIVSLVGCGAAGDGASDSPAGFPAAESDGVWRVDVGDTAATLRLLPGLARAELDVGCAPLLGAYSFSADGRAGFTLPGRGADDCADASGQDAARTALERIERWEPDGDGYRLTGPDTELRLVPA